MHNPQVDALGIKAKQAVSERRFADAEGLYRRILDLDPAQPRAWLALSALAQRAGGFREAVLATRAAADAWRCSDSQQFLAEVSKRLLVLGEYQQAREVLLSADVSDPSVLRHSMGLVQFLGLVDAHEDALQLADHALAHWRDPPASLIRARATVLRHLGRMQEATDAFEQCIALDPLHAEAHWALAHHARSPQPAGRVSRLRRAIAHTDAASEDAIYLHYALFKELDDAGDAAHAWEVLKRGAELKRATLRHDPAVDDRRYDSLMTLCDTRFIHAPAPEVRAAHRPVFIVGLPRSGTTVVERMLGAHAQVRSAGELNDFGAQLSWEMDRFLSEPLDERALEAIERIDFQALGQGYLNRTAWRAGDARVLIDKLPNNLLHAAFIHRALPQARIICVRRGFADSSFSMFKHLFADRAYAYSYVPQETVAHYRRFDRLVDHWSRTLSDRWLLIEYEQLVREPAAFASRIADFCQIEPDDAMAHIEENRTPSSTASASQIREAIHNRNVGSWQRYAEWWPFKAEPCGDSAADIA